jgi:nitroimidazol reductase NimA-like FMN-containing flavoprotein (pyridoxamine 5'-phosphate oxidase superfamily)
MFEMNPEDIEQRLENTRIGRLCMASADGVPYAIPMPFCWHAGALYLRIPMAGRKGSILSENPRVCFEIDWHTDTLDDYGSVIVEGEIEVVKDLEEKAGAHAANDAKYNRLRKGFRPGHGRGTPLERLALQRITVYKISGRQKMPAAGPEYASAGTGNARVTAP